MCQFSLADQFQDTDDDDIPEEGVVERLTGFAYKEWKAKALFWRFFDIIKVRCLIKFDTTLANFVTQPLGKFLHSPFSVSSISIEE